MGLSIAEELGWTCIQSWLLWRSLSVMLEVYLEGYVGMEGGGSGTSDTIVEPSGGVVSLIQ